MRQKEGKCISLQPVYSPRENKIILQSYFPNFTSHCAEEMNVFVGYELGSKCHMHLTRNIPLNLFCSTNCPHILVLIKTNLS